jgi:hypothetical protein
MYTIIYVYMYMYIYIYTHTERERERERQKQREIYYSAIIKELNPVICGKSGWSTQCDS